MAGNNILPIILVGGAAYLAWNWYQSGGFGTASVMAAGGGPTPGPVPVPVVTPALAPVVVTTPPAPSAATATAAEVAVAVKLLAAAGNTSKLNADQWQFYWNQLGLTPIAGSDFTAAFFPNGRPSDPLQYTQYSAIEFATAVGNQIGADIALAATAGVHGFSGLPVPVFYRGRGFGGVGYTMADFRRAGRR